MKKTKPEISLLVAVAAMKGELDDFRIWWEEKCRKEPVDYSTTYPTLEEWEDQFQAWRDLKDTP